MTSGAARGRPRGLVLWLFGLGVTVVLAAVVSSFASSAPDGLERVAVDQGFVAEADEHDLAGSPLAGYEADGVDDHRLATGLAGVVGVAATLAVGGGVLWSLRRTDRRSRAAAEPG